MWAPIRSRATPVSDMASRLVEPASRRPDRTALIVYQAMVLGVTVFPRWRADWYVCHDRAMASAARSFCRSGPFDKKRQRNRLDNSGSIFSNSRWICVSVGAVSATIWASPFGNGQRPLRRVPKRRHPPIPRRQRSQGNRPPPCEGIKIRMYSPPVQVRIGGIQDVVKSDENLPPDCLCEIIEKLVSLQYFIADIVDMLSVIGYLTVILGSGSNLRTAILVFSATCLFSGKRGERYDRHSRHVAGEKILHFVDFPQNFSKTLRYCYCSDDREAFLRNPACPILAGEAAAQQPSYSSRGLWVSV